MKKLQLERGINKWKRIAEEDKGKNAIRLWRKAFKEKKDKDRKK